ncbi:MAG TPA: hypothetical protein DCW31_04770 [Lactobacillus sp.]|nr:hypothetical protein [Lactobacillus sp.]
MKQRRHLVISLLLIGILIGAWLYRNAIKEIIGTATVQSTDLSRLKYAQLRLNQSFNPRSVDVRQAGEQPKLSDYRLGGQQGALVTTNARRQVVGLALLDTVSGGDNHFDNGLALNLTLSHVKRLLGSHYVMFDTERYGPVVLFVDKVHNYRLLLGLDATKRVTALVLYNRRQYDYQY